MLHWGFSVIDQEDQQYLFRLGRGRGKDKGLPTAAQIQNLYSLARNTLGSLDEILQAYAPEAYKHKAQLAEIA